MKTLLFIDAGAVIGPSLAAVGASFTVTLIPKKPLTLKRLEKLRQKRAFPNPTKLLGRQEAQPEWDEALVHTAAVGEKGIWQSKVS